MKSYIPQNSFKKVYKLKYVVTPSRFYNGADFLELTQIKIICAIKEMSSFLKNENNRFPAFEQCIISRIDLTENVYV